MLNDILKSKPVRSISAITSLVGILISGCAPTISTNSDYSSGIIHPDSSEFKKDYHKERNAAFARNLDGYGIGINTPNPAKIGKKVPFILMLPPTEDKAYEILVNVIAYPKDSTEEERVIKEERFSVGNMQYPGAINYDFLVQKQMEKYMIKVKSTILGSHSAKDSTISSVFIHPEP